MDFELTKDSVVKKMQFNNTKEIYTLFIASYIILCLVSFILLSFFSKHYLSGLLKSQNYSISTQNWRRVVNGVRSGWYMPSLIGIEIVKKEQAVDHWGKNNKFNYIKGNVVKASYSVYTVYISFSYSLWVLACLLSAISLILIYLLYVPLKVPLMKRSNLLLLKEIENFFETGMASNSKLNEFEVVIRKQSEKIMDLSKKAALTEISKSVAHDIRSPLSALNILSQSNKSMSDEEKSLIKGVVERINGIAEDLLNKSRENKSICFILPIVENLVFQKKTEYSKNNQINFIIEKTDITEESTAAIDQVVLERILSNLINNAVEASPGKSEVVIILKDEENSLLISVIDQGIGMSEEIIKKLGSEELSFGKNKQGSGIGILNAKKALNDVGGTISFKSKIGMGTRVDIKLRKKSNNLTKREASESIKTQV